MKVGSTVELGVVLAHRDRCFLRLGVLKLELGLGTLPQYPLARDLEMEMVSL